MPTRRGQHSDPWSEQAIGIRGRRGIGMMVQIGFLAHQIAITAPLLGAAGASATVVALLGRLMLVRSADQVDARTACAVLLLAAAALSAWALFPVPAMLVGASAVYGLTVGNVTTLSPMIVRREFGAATFGVTLAPLPWGSSLPRPWDRASMACSTMHLAAMASCCSTLRR